MARVSDEELHQRARELADKLLARGWMLASAESCTGGWVGQLLTSLPGSSQWYERGFITYANAAKIEMLGVPEATLATHGAVSEETARAMATARWRAATHTPRSPFPVSPDPTAARRKNRSVWCATAGRWRTAQPCRPPAASAATARKSVRVRWPRHCAG